VGLDVLVPGDAAAIGEHAELRDELAVRERAEPRAVSVLGQPAGVGRPLLVERTGNVEFPALVGGEPEFEGLPPVLLAHQRPVISEEIPMRGLTQVWGRHDRAPLDPETGLVQARAIGRVRLGGVDAERHVTGGGEDFGEACQPRGRVPGFRRGREEQEVAPPVRRVRRAPDHDVVTAVGDLAALHPSDHQIRAVTEGGDVHGRGTDGVISSGLGQGPWADLTGRGAGGRRT
jgi:hypothetical protein